MVFGEDLIIDVEQLFVLGLFWTFLGHLSIVHKIVSIFFAVSQINKTLVQICKIVTILEMQII